MPADGGGLAVRALCVLRDENREVIRRLAGDFIRHVDDGRLRRAVGQPRVHRRFKGKGVVSGVGIGCVEHRSDFVVAGQLRIAVAVDVRRGGFVRARRVKVFARQIVGKFIAVRQRGQRQQHQQENRQQIPECSLHARAPLLKSADALMAATLPSPTALAICSG